MSKKIISNANIINYLTEIQKIVHLKDNQIEWLLKPKQTSYAKLEVDGRKLPAWRVLFNDVLGPGKGGIRFHPQVSQKEVSSLAFWMMIKNSLAGLPFGGAKGGVKFNPKNVSRKKLEKISRKYIKAFYSVLGQDKDVPAPDVYTNPQVMAWMLDEFEKRIGTHQPGMITGKPLELQGCALRGNATAKGGFIIFQEMVKEFKLEKNNLEVAIQGFGNAGANLSKMLYQSGFKIVAVSDSRGGVYSQAGLAIDQLVEIKNESGKVDKFSPADKISNQELLELPVDILVLAALEDQITKNNADNIQAQYILEIANGPTTHKADKILKDKGVVVVPDVLANAGGVTASYFEWAQNRTGNVLDKDYLEKLLNQKMTNSWQRVISRQKEDKAVEDLRTAAYLIAVKRILRAGELRGELNKKS